MSLSAMLFKILQMERSCCSLSSAGMRGGMCGRSLSSIEQRRFLDACASPAKRSRAIGGHIAIRIIGRISGCCINMRGVILRRKSVCSIARMTVPAVRSRVARNACGANSTNQRLNISTDFAVSSFHESMRSRLIHIPNTSHCICFLKTF